MFIETRSFLSSEIPVLEERQTKKGHEHGQGAVELTIAGAQREGATIMIVLHLIAAFMPRCLTKKAGADEPAWRSRRSTV